MQPSQITINGRRVMRRDPRRTRDPITVAQIVTRLNIGGPAIQLLILSRDLPASQYRNVLITGKCEPDDGDMSYMLSESDAVIHVPELSRSVRPWRNLSALWRLWKHLRALRPDVVHTHTAMAGCLGRLAALSSGVPVIVHTFHGNSLAEYFSPLQAALFRRIEQLLARFTDVLCVVSPQQAEELSGRFAIARRKQFRVVPLGLDLDDYLALQPPEGRRPLTVGWFGRMVPVKNVPLLAATIETVLHLCPDTRFLIAGDGPERAALEPVLCRHAKCVEWLGWQREILPLLARCHLLLQTSRNEGTPVALIQGMAAARPFVSTAVGGVVDMVAGDAFRRGAGVRWYGNGVLADSDAVALARAIVTLAEDGSLLKRMGHAARAFARREYRKEKFVSNMDALYQELWMARKRS